MLQIESQVERGVKKDITAWAFEKDIPLKFFKLNVLGIRGWPDRIMMWPNRHILFIEFKREGEQPRKLQEWVHNWLMEAGFTVRIYDDRRIAVDDIKTIVLSTLSADEGDEVNDEQRWGKDIPKAGAGQDSGGSESLHCTEESGHGRCPSCGRPFASHSDFLAATNLPLG